jgi:ABC-type Fe3+-hydroxamate transport system substrate-binding protein
MAGNWMKLRYLATSIVAVSALLFSMPAPAREAEAIGGVDAKQGQVDTMRRGDATHGPVLSNNPAPPLHRIVSLAPSNTELLYAINAENALVGVCSFCDYPEAAKKLEKAGSFVSANLERMTRLKPDIVVLVSGQEALASLLRHNGFNVQLLQNTRLSDISKNIRSLGKITGKEERSLEIATKFDKAIVSLHAVLSSAKSCPKVFYCVWPQPLLTIGKNSYLDDIVTTCDGANIAADSSTAYPHFSAEKLVLSDPDIVILPYEAHNRVNLKAAPWSLLRAVKQSKVYYLPEPEKNGLIRPTTRVINGLYWLCDRLHPELSASLRAWYDKNKAGA